MLFLTPLFMVPGGGFGAISELKTTKILIKYDFLGKVATCVSIDKYHIELKVGPLRIDPQIDKQVV